MFFQPLFKKWTPQKVSGVYCITTEPKCFFFSHDFTAVEKQQLYVSHIVCDLLWMCMMGIQYLWILFGFSKHEHNIHFFLSFCFC